MLPVIEILWILKDLVWWGVTLCTWPTLEQSASFMLCGVFTADRKSVV